MDGLFGCYSIIDPSITDTTRAPRPTELDGKHYHFVSRDRFKALIDYGAFIEHAQFSGNCYGTSFMTVDMVTASGRRCLLDIDSQVGQHPSSIAVALLIASPSTRAFDR